MGSCLSQPLITHVHSGKVSHPDEERPRHDHSDTEDSNRRGVDKSEELQKAGSVLTRPISAEGLTESVFNTGNHYLVTQAPEHFVKGRKLGQGGFGVVWKCERSRSYKEGQGRWMPKEFALKELVSTNIFIPGVSSNIREFLPLDEAAIQRYMRHEHIVETYWADVRCLDPDSMKPLNIEAGDLVSTGGTTWKSLDALSDVEQTCTAAPGQPPPPPVKLQMRIAMELCDLGSLKDYLVDPKRFELKSLSEKICVRKLGKRIQPAMCALLTGLDIAQALSFMHKTSTLHGDLKPHNILLKSDPKDTARGFSAKISDFGLAAHMTREQSSVSISVGTEAYLPPEVFRTMAVTEASDVYTLGLLIWEIWYGIFWWSVYDREKRKRGVKSAVGMADYGPRCCDRCPRKFAEVVHACLNKDTTKRPTAKEVVHALTDLIAAQEQQSSIST